MEIPDLESEALSGEVRAYIAYLEQEVFLLKERLDLLLYKRFARSSERSLAGGQQQLSFAEEAEPEEAQTPADAEEKQEVKSYARKKPGRKPIDDSLPRQELLVDIPEDEKTCACGAQLARIGEETSEKLEIIPPSMYVLRTVRPKYACRCCEGVEDEEEPAVKIAPAPPAIIPRSIASASLLSCIMIQKYQDHLPFYRQEKQFQRIGVQISRQDMSNWQQKVYAKLEPLFDLMKQALKSGPVMRMDETTVQVMGEEGRSDTQKSYMWLARGGPPGKTVAWYEYHPTRGHEHAKAMLEGFSGHLQTDGYEGYVKAVAGRDDIVHVGCFAHARRKFFEASKVSKAPQSAEEGLKYIRKLYDLEDELRGKKLAEADFLAKRKEKAEPILAAFRGWLENQADAVPPSQLLGQAVRYTLNQ
jgi:transposase